MFEMPPKCPGGRRRARAAAHRMWGSGVASLHYLSPIRRVYPAMKTSNHATMNSSGLHSILGGGRGGHVRA